MPDDELHSGKENGRPFPWHCGRCRRKEVRLTLMPFRDEYTFEGREYRVEIPELATPGCAHCGDVVLSYAQTDEIWRALRAQIGLLEPEEVQAGRSALRLSQRELADRIGVAEEKIDRWENIFEIQSKLADNLLRVFFASAEARSILTAPRSVTASGVPIPSVPSAASGEPVRSAGWTNKGVRKPFARGPLSDGPADESSFPNLTPRLRRHPLLAAKGTATGHAPPHRRQLRFRLHCICPNRPVFRTRQRPIGKQGPCRRVTALAPPQTAPTPVLRAPHQASAGRSVQHGERP